MTQTIRRELRLKFEALGESAERAELLADAALQVRGMNVPLRGIEAAIAMNRPVTQEDLPDPRVGEVALQIERGLGVRPDFGRPGWETVVKTIIKREAEGQLLQTYIDWCKAHPFDAPKVGQIAQRPTIILDTWPAAFGPTEPLPKYYRDLP